jgi:hypothetical protein
VRLEIFDTGARGFGLSHFVFSFCMYSY